MSSVEVSVLIPAYNAQSFLAEAVESVLAQSWSGSLEIVVYDDGSSDDTRQVARSFGPRLRLLEGPGGQGAAHGRNQAVEHSSGELLAFLDSDDLWLPEKLALQMPRLAERAKSMVFGQVQEFCEKGPRGDFRDCCLPSCCLVRRADFLAVGEFDATLKVAEFAEWLSRAQDLGYAFDIVPQPVARRRIHDTNLGIRARDDRRDYLEVARRRLARRRKQS